MENSKNHLNYRLKKCPYHISVYGEANCELIYRTSYKGDWGDWDEPAEKKQNLKGAGSKKYTIPARETPLVKL